MSGGLPSNQSSAHQAELLVCGLPYLTDVWNVHISTVSYHKTIKQSSAQSASQAVRSDVFEAA